MNHQTNKLIIGIFYLIIISTFSAKAQTNTISPYSRFGPGDLIYNGYANQIGLAGVSIAGNSATKLNFNNPASYAYDTLMVLDFALNSEVVIQKQTGISTRQLNTTINNFFTSIVSNLNTIMSTYVPVGVTSKNAIGAPKVTSHSLECNCEEVPRRCWASTRARRVRPTTPIIA